MSAYTLDTATDTLLIAAAAAYQSRAKIAKAIHRTEWYVRNRLSDPRIQERVEDLRRERAIDRASQIEEIKYKAFNLLSTLLDTALTLRDRMALIKLILKLPMPAIPEEVIVCPPEEPRSVEDNQDREFVPSPREPVAHEARPEDNGFAPPPESQKTDPNRANPAEQGKNSCETSVPPLLINDENRAEPVEQATGKVLNRHTRRFMERMKRKAAAQK